MPGIVNSSNSSTDGQRCSPSPVDEHSASYIFRAVAMSLIIIFSLVGNVLVCVGANSRRNRPFSYYLVINLAVAELIITTIQPFLFHYNTKPFSWVFGGFLCHLLNPMIVCATSVVTFTLSVIAVHRCRVMLRPYRHRPTKCVTFVVIACSWIWSIALAMPSAVTRKVTDEYLANCGILRCDEVFPTEEAMHLYSKFLFALEFVVPFVVMVISYGLVICRVKSHIHRARTQECIEDSDIDQPKSSQCGSYELNQLQLKATPPPAAPVNVTEPQIFEQENQGFRKQSAKQENKKMKQLENDVLNMIYIIIIVFFLCYLPAQIVFILREEKAFSITKWSHSYIFSRYLDVLHALPSAVHPILYRTMSKVVALKITCLRNKTDSRLM